MKLPQHSRHYSRRALIGLGLLSIAGCASPSASPGTVTTPEPVEPEHTPSPPEQDEAKTPEDPSSQVDEPQAGAATREEIVAELGERRPQEWGLNLPGELVRTQLDTVAITLDACGGPGGSGVDHALLDLLREHEVAATLFLNARWYRTNAEVALELVADPRFRLASHGDRHVPLSVNGRDAYGITGTADVGEVVDEVTATDDWFREHTGSVPEFMRPGTAYADDVAIEAAGMLKRTIAGFSVNGDGGAQFSAGQVAEALAPVQAGDIVLAHMNQPGGGTAEGFRQALPRLLDSGVRFGYLD